MAIKFVETRQLKDDAGFDLNVPVYAQSNERTSPVVMKELERSAAKSCGICHRGKYLLMRLFFLSTSWRYWLDQSKKTSDPVKRGGRIWPINFVFYSVYREAISRIF